MDDDMARRVNDLLREAEELKAHRRDRRKGGRAGKTDDGEMLFSELEDIGDDIDDMVEDLKESLNGISEMAEEKIAEHPIAIPALTFALGFLIGRLTKSQAPVE